MQAADYTANGLKIEGNWENDRNAEHRELYMRVIKEVFNADQMIIAHHLVYSVQEGDYFIVEEIPSADTLLFDHDIMRKLFGDDKYKDVLHALAITSPAHREQTLQAFLDQRDHDTLTED